jgi:hypothetical protein
MARRAWLLAGVALMLSGSSGCRLFCERYCERDREHCERINQNRGCCVPAAAPALQCPPGTVPATGYYPVQPYCP